MKQRNLNFRQSSSERKATGAYGNFRKEIVRKLKIDKFVSRWNFKKNKINK
nr:hypothetical protein [Candidatus Levybacteria bacterium]